MGNLINKEPEEVSDLDDNSVTKTSPDEEIIIMSSVQEITKRFVKDYQIIWHDPNINSDENSQYMTNLQSLCEVKTFNNWQQAADYIEGTKATCHVLTSGTDGENLVNKVSSFSHVLSIYVFCSNIDYHSKWAAKQAKVCCVEDDFQALVSKFNENLIKWQRENSSLRVDFPAFSPIFDDMNKSEIASLHLYLKGLVNFENRVQAKRDFLALAKSIYPDKDNMADFEKDYTDYDTKTILNWYTKESFLYKVTNNCLRIATPDSIQYCRLILKDLEHAIKERYRAVHKDFSGILYRGAYITGKEWEKLKQNVGKDIEMYGFLSTSKQREVALKFAQSDMDKKAMITIIVPTISETGGQGFAEVKEFSDFSNEDEVLFNVRSRFTILEVVNEKINGVECRHLILLYGAQAIRRYIREKTPEIGVTIDNIDHAMCYMCKSGLKVSEEDIFVNLINKSQLICHDGALEFQAHSLAPLLCIPAFYQKTSMSPENKLNLKVEGVVNQFNEDVKIPFYGYKCTICQNRRVACYKCLNCKEEKMWCDKCLKQSNDCVNEGHLLVFESIPYTFWSERMSDLEWGHMGYQKQISQAFTLFYQAELFYRTHDFKRTIEYYEKFLEKNKNNGGSNNSEHIVTAYERLGVAYRNSRKYEIALEYLEKALEAYKEKDSQAEIANCYHNLGLAYGFLDNNDKALECYLQALEIRKSLYGEKDKRVASSYNALALLYNRLDKKEEALLYHQKALEIRLELGDTLLSTAASYQNIGKLYSDQKENEKALECFSQALEIRKLAHGDKHPDTGTSYQRVGEAYDKLGQYEKAKECFLKALEIAKSLDESKFLKTLPLYYNTGIGKICKKLHQTEEAKEYFLKTLEYRLKLLEIKKAKLGDQCLEIASLYQNIGEVYKNLEQYDEEKEYFLKALEVRKALNVENHKDASSLYYRLGGLYIVLKQYEQAIEYISKNYEINKKALGDKHKHTLQAKKALQKAQEELESQKNIDTNTTSS